MGYAAVCVHGRTVEQGPKQAIFDAPQHPYTIALLGSTPSVDPQQRRDRVVLKGEMPSPLNPPSGCAFNGRCPYATDLCGKERPELRPVGGHTVACHHAEAIGR